VDSRGLSYDDVLCEPRKSVLKSRKDADLTSRLSTRVQIPTPLVAAPMPSVVDAKTAKIFFEHGAFSFLHRFQTPKEQAEEFGLATVDNITDREYVCGAAFGLKDAQERIEVLWEAGCRVFLLDTAHAHNEHVMEEFGLIRFPDDAEVIVGSIATAEAATEYAQMGVAGLRVGIGPGAACRTREVTGFGVGQLTAIVEVATAVEMSDWKPTIIADGGIKNSGDIIKALVAGANTVMIGKLFAGCTDKHPQEYFGMASSKVNGHRAPEGVAGVVMEGVLEDRIKELLWGIRSGVSYGGVTSVEELAYHVELIINAPGVIMESNTRI
jgi:IMP dehydrogenase